jgi:hypothetical protein
LVALVLVAVAASMFLYFADALRITRLARQETTATAYAKNYLTSLQSYWQDPDNYVYGLAYADKLAATVPEPFSLNVTIKDEKGSELVNFPDDKTSTEKNVSRLRQITVTLLDNQGRSLSMQSSISYPPPRP